MCKGDCSNSSSIILLDSGSNVSSTERSTVGADFCSSEMDGADCAFGFANFFGGNSTAAAASEEEPSEEEAPLEEGTVIDPQTGETVTMPDPDSVDQSSDDVLGDSPVNENLVDIVPQDGAEDSSAGNPTE